MLIELVNGLRKWEEHVLQCKQCDAYDRAKPLVVDDIIIPVPNEPCGIGRALILNLLRLLEKGI